jgi:outer membrane protein assembly factor BamD (BamD/ComL family)
MMKKILSFIYFFSLILMVAGCANPEQSFQKAEQLRAKEAYTQFINDFPESKWVKKAEQRIAEIELWQTIEASQTLEDYEAYITSFSDGIFHKEAQSRMLDIKKFKAARDKDILAHYQNYLGNYPQGLFAQEATKRSAELVPADIGYQIIKSETNTEALKAYAKEFKDTGYSQLIKNYLQNLSTGTPAFQKAEKLRSKKAYQQFLKDFPKSKWVKKARQRIAELDFWDKIRLSQTLRDYERYLNAYSNGFFRQQAVARIQEIQDMTVARKKDMIQSYQRFLDKHPKGLFVSKAQKRIAELKPAKIAYRRIKAETNTEVLRAYLKPFRHTGYGQLVLGHLEAQAAKLPVEEPVVSSSEQTETLPQPPFDPSSPNIIRAVQELLTQQGLNPGPVDGRMGRKTRRAIRQFQRQVGMTVDGKITEEFLQQLRGQAQ